MQGCQPPTSSNIENMIGSQEDDRWCHNACHIDVILVDCECVILKKHQQQQHKIFEVLLSGSRVYKK